MFARMNSVRTLAVIALVFTGAHLVFAQAPGSELSGVLVSRPTLESLLTRYLDAAQSRDFSSASRDRFRALAEQVRTRLAEGDFHVGDRIALAVEGESTLTNNFPVSSGRQLILPNIGTIPLQGVLRYDLSDYLTSRLRQFLRDPRVRARALIRVERTGAVSKQGFS